MPHLWKVGEFVRCLESEVIYAKVLLPYLIDSETQTLFTFDIPEICTYPAVDGPLQLLMPYICCHHGFFACTHLVLAILDVIVSIEFYAYLILHKLFN